MCLGRLPGDIVHTDNGSKSMTREIAGAHLYSSVEVANKIVEDAKDYAREVHNTAYRQGIRASQHLELINKERARVAADLLKMRTELTSLRDK